MHGPEAEECKRRLHMPPVPVPGTAASSTPSATAPLALTPPPVTSEADSSHSSCGFFLKDGRKIQAGDCALFQAGSAPPFIGLIRSITTSKEDHLKIHVNWLYRPADIKLAKGILLEAAPNEVFYSFHKDVIPAASLLHPCKVAFLRKGVELSAGISSFVCRRVYDISNKCLWWLTDQDYINEHQEEVDQLLEKNQQEMHTAVQSSGLLSPKQLNGPNDTQQLKPGAETSFSSQPKGKKRERIDQTTEPIKRERFAKSEDGDSIGGKLDNTIKAELAKITEKGGLVNSEGVEKLVNLMQPDKSDGKIDLGGRIMVAEVIAATDRYDCLGRFVQLRGLAVLDDWLQEAHKGKSGDGSSPKECDKPTEELLLALLRALDKLPVNLNALQTCNIGKSVNHLRSYKNVDIQKKARTLVDTWKKRVDAEMIKINDAKATGVNQSASCPVKPGFSDVSPGGNRRPGSSDTAARNPATQHPACKSLPGKSLASEALVKSIPVPGPIKCASTSPTSHSFSLKDSLSRTTLNSGGTEMPPTAVKEEKSSSSSQSQNNSQSCSSEHGKPVGSSWKEDSRSSTAMSVNAVKAGGSSHHRRSSNGLLSGVQKEGCHGKSGSLNKSMSTEKASQSGLIGEKTLDTDTGNHHRLIVRLPNPGRSPAWSAIGGAFEDPSVMGSRASSPGIPDKNDHGDRKKVRSEACKAQTNEDANVGCWQNSDVKEGIVGAEEVMKSPVASVDDEHSRSADETGKCLDTSRTIYGSSGHERAIILTEPRIRSSYSSINALIESCAKYSEPNAPLAVGDDIGMNLLASVAAGEICKSDSASPTSSPRTSPPTDDPLASNGDAKTRLPCDVYIAQGHIKSGESAEGDSEKWPKSFGYVLATDENQQDDTNVPGSIKLPASVQDLKLTIVQVEKSSITSMVPQNFANSDVKSEGQLEGDRLDGSYSLSKSSETKEEGEANRQVRDNYNNKQKEQTLLSVESKPNVVCPKTLGNLCTSDDMGEGCKQDLGASGNTLVVQAPKLCSPRKGMPGSSNINDNQQPQSLEDVERTGHDASVACEHDALQSSNVDETNAGINDKKQVSFAKELGRPAVSNLDTTIKHNKIKEVHEDCPAESVGREASTAFTGQEAEHHEKPTGSKLYGIESDSREEHASSAGASSLPEPNVSAKLDFDLNEGIEGDDGGQGEPTTSSSTICPSAIHLPGLSPLANTKLNGLPVPITVAPAKGPFLPPEILLKSKGEPGWRGSAATSAFRPAEPRKVLEMPPCTSDTSHSDSGGKHGRPPLDIDLNVADERFLEDIASHSVDNTKGSEYGTFNNLDAPSRHSGGLDLDLNQTDKGAENCQVSVSCSRGLEVPLFQVKPASGGFTNNEVNILRGFDLNCGPGIDEVSADPAPRSQNSKSSSSALFSPQIGGLRMNNAELGSISSWFPPGNSYPAVAIPSFLPERGEQLYPIVAAPGAQRILSSVSGGGAFGGEIYRGPVLSSSPAMTFSPATAFPYSGFPFGTSFPLAPTSFAGGSTTYIDSTPGGSSCFPSIPSQLVAPNSAVASHYPRPYLVSLPEVSATTGTDSSRRWSRQGLDLNAGPGNVDIESKDERVPSASRPLLVGTSQVLMDEHARIYGMPGGNLKRKEPEGGWDADKSAYKQLSWQ